MQILLLSISITYAIYWGELKWIGSMPAYYSGCFVDYNGDNTTDIIFLNDEGIWLHENIKGHFMAEKLLIKFNADSEKDRIAINDINGDGKLEIIHVDSTGSIGWFPFPMHNDSVNIQRQPLIRKDEAVFSMLIGDLDGDHDNDILVWHADSGIVTFYRNYHGGSNHIRFLKWNIEKIPHRFGSMAFPVLADMNADNHIDIVFPAYDSIFIFSSDVEIFIKKIVTENQPTQINVIVPADLDGDGDMDVVAIETSFVTWYENRQLETYEKHFIAEGFDMHSLAVGDLDNDGDLDLVVDNIWYENDGNCSFSYPKDIVDTASTVRKVILADIDMDTDLDIIFIDYDGGIAWCENSPLKFEKENNIHVSRQFGSNFTIMGILIILLILCICIVIEEIVNYDRMPDSKNK